MADVFLEWNSDFQVDSTGDLQVIDGDVEVRQRLERRLFTAVQGYLWHPEYGAGLPQKVGSVYSLSQIESIVLSQINLEASVATTPPVQVFFNQTPGGLVGIGIKYWDAATGVAVSFTITN